MPDLLLIPIKCDAKPHASPSLQDLMAQNGITYVLNASNTCPKPDFISESHFMRIPVNDNYCEKLLPWLDKTNEFIGKEEGEGCRKIRCFVFGLKVKTGSTKQEVWR